MASTTIPPTHLQTVRSGQGVASEDDSSGLAFLRIEFGQIRDLLEGEFARIKARDGRSLVGLRRDGYVIVAMTALAGGGVLLALDRPAAIGSR